jgi:hypothetical protein
MPASRSATETLDREFLTMRSKLIELAAALDRIDRGQGSPDEDPRWEPLHRAIALLASPEGGRAERIEMLFSLPYDPRWRAAPSP